jgi:hypothetical protein
MDPIIGYQLGNNFALEAPIDQQTIRHIKQRYGAYLSSNKKLWILPNTKYQTIVNDRYLSYIVDKKNLPTNTLINQSSSKTTSLMQEYSPSRTETKGLIQKNNSREYYSPRHKSPGYASQKNTQIYYSQRSPTLTHAIQSIPNKQSQLSRRDNIEDLSQSNSVNKMTIFPTGIIELDRQIIAEASISDLINMYDVSHYFRDLLDDPYTFVIFKNKYPFTVMTSFQDFLTLNDELKTTIPRPIDPDFRMGRQLYLPGDRLLSESSQITMNNYKVIKVVSKEKLHLYKVDMLGNPIEKDLIEAIDEYPYVMENGVPVPLYKGILKHQLGPRIKSIDSPFLLYKTNPLNDNFKILRSKYPTEKNYKAHLHVGLVSTVEYDAIKNYLRFPYVIDNLYDDNVILKYIGKGDQGGLFDSTVYPLVLHIRYIHESNTWYSPEYGTIILTPGDWREGYVNLMSKYG